MTAFGVSGSSQWECFLRSLLRFSLYETFCCSLRSPVASVANKLGQKRNLVGPRAHPNPPAALGDKYLFPQSSYRRPYDETSPVLVPNRWLHVWAEATFRSKSIRRHSDLQNLPRRDSRKGKGKDEGDRTTAQLLSYPGGLSLYPIVTCLQKLYLHDKRCNTSNWRAAVINEGIVSRVSWQLCFYRWIYS